MANVAEQVKAAQQAVERIKTRKAELEGRRKQLLETLQKDFNVTTVEEARKLLESLESELADKEEQLTDLSGELDDLMTEMGEGE